MTPEQAISILNQMSGRADGNRADHLLAIEAVDLLTAVFTPSELPPPPDVAPDEPPDVAPPDVADGAPLDDP